MPRAAAVQMYDVLSRLTYTPDELHAAREALDAAIAAGTAVVTVSAVDSTCVDIELYPPPPAGTVLVTAGAEMTVPRYGTAAYSQTRAAGTSTVGALEGSGGAGTGTHGRSRRGRNAGTSASADTLTRSRSEVL